MAREAGPPRQVAGPQVPLPVRHCGPGHRPSVLFAGLTAAGKTTHAHLLAQDLGYSYVSATEIIAAMMGLPRSSVDSTFWHVHGDAVRQLRDSEGLDARLDAQLLDLVARECGLVVDTWAMPWLVHDEDPVRVWISSDLRSRTMKAAVSDENRRSLGWYQSFISSKDAESRRRFLDLYHFDLLAPPDRFDVVIDNSHYIVDASRQSADRGIALFRPVLRDAVQEILDERFRVSAEGRPL